MNKHILYGVMAFVMGCTTVACSDDDVDVYTAPIVSEIQTGDAQTTATTATINGVARDLSSQFAEAYTVGVVYSTTADPCAGGTTQVGVMGENGNFVTTLTDLQEGCTYYYAAYVNLQGRLTYYGDVKSFVTTAGQAGTAEAASVTATSATLGGTVNGVSELIEAGSLDYGVAIAATADGVATSPIRIAAEGTTNSFTVAATTLVPNTTYHYASYMVVGGEEIFGNVKSFTTPMLCDASAESIDDYVDMGTKMEWCRYNIGGAAEGEAGALFGYGDVTGLNRSLSVADYASGNITGTSADVAFASGMGQLPTKADFEELISVSDVEETSLNGVACVKFTSRTTGNSIVFPLAGIRGSEGSEAAGSLGLYATGETYADQPDYAHAMRLGNGAPSVELLSRATGVSVRPVRKPFVTVLEVDNNKIIVGDLENNGRIRLELYSEFGGTSTDPSFPLNRFSFEKVMAVTFRLSGVTGNLKADAPTSFKAGLEFAAGGWYPSYWSTFDNNRFDCVVTGDGTYTVWYEAEAPVNGAVVFDIDIDGLGNALDDMSKFSAEVLGITLDPDKPVVQDIAVDNAKVLFNNKDGNGTDGRIEIFNEFGDTKGLGADYSWMSFPCGTMTVNFTLTGIDGNLKAGAAGEYKADISYATSSWWPSYWGGQVATANVTGDGTYSAQCWLEAQCDGAVVWCVEVYGLWADLEDTSKVKATINSVTVPAFAE